MGQTTRLASDVLFEHTVPFDHSNVRELRVVDVEGPDVGRREAEQVDQGRSKDATVGHYEMTAFMGDELVAERGRTSFDMPPRLTSRRDGLVYVSVVERYACLNDLVEVHPFRISEVQLDETVVQMDRKMSGI